MISYEKDQDNIGQVETSIGLGQRENKKEREREKERQRETKRERQREGGRARGNNGQTHRHT